VASSRNCPTCCNRIKVDGFDGNPNGLGDFWRCTAVPLVPAFTGQFLYGGDQQLVNLGSFKPGHPCAEYQNAKSCPLWASVDEVEQA
jgi:hypothetical protein